MLVLLIIICCVLSLAVPCAFYVGLQSGRSEADRVERFGKDALETLRASSLTDKVQAEGLRERAAVLRKQLVESFNEELLKVKQEQNEMIEAQRADGSTVRIARKNLEPLSPDEMRRFEPL